MSPPQRLKALTGHLVPITAPVAGRPAEGAAPLAGITVLEVANWIAAPCCGATMAAMGAEVIKVEPPFGDGMRYVLRQHGHDGRPQTRDEIGTFPDIHFNQENSSKKGIAVALDMDEGQQVVHRLLEQADVMITNLLPDRLNRYSLDFETVHRINPSVVIASVSSYGLEGPSADWPGFDVGALFARGGHASLHGTEKFLSRAGYGDHCAGLSILSATLGALMMRQQTGKGTVVSTSLLRLSQWMIASDMAPALNDGMQPTSAMDALQVPEGGLPDGLPVSSGTYRTADERWIRLTGATKMPALLKGIGLEELLSDPRYGGGRMDPDVKAELTERIQAAFATRTLEDWKQSGDLDATFYRCEAVVVLTISFPCYETRSFCPAYNKHKES